MDLENKKIYNWESGFMKKMDADLKPW